MAAPSCIQRYLTAVADGLHVGALARRADPTFAKPEMRAPALARSGTSRKWTKPLGQPPPERVTRVQEKSPLQLSWESTTSFAEITFSTYATCPAEPAGRTPAFHQATAPTRGTPLVMRLIREPQLVALPPPFHGREAGMPALIIR